MITLRVIVDDMLDSAPRGPARNAEELTRALIQTAPPGASVEGVVAASTEAEYASIQERLPGLAGLYKNALARRELTLAWQHGFTRLPGGGMIHSPSLFAPLARHDRLNDVGEQTVVTISDAFAWTHPDSMPSRKAAWTIAMAKRAHRHADAVVVPTHATADRLAEFIDFGDRIRIIGGAPSTLLALPEDQDARAAALDLPERYLLAFGGLVPRRGNRQLIRALAHLDGVPLLLVGPTSADDLAAAATEAGVDASRVRGLDGVGNTDLAVVIARATALVIPTLEEGFSLPMVEAFRLGTPVVHTDAPALLEVSGDSGVVVELGEPEGFPTRLADGIRSVLDDEALAGRLVVYGEDRSRVFSWRGSAEKVWQLHADL